MIIGDFHIEQLSEGRFEINRNGDIFKVTSDELITASPALMESSDPDDFSKLEASLEEQYGFTKDARIVGIDPVLVRTKEHVVLLDAGLGMGLDVLDLEREQSNVVTNLEIFGVYPDEVTHVILTHLHHDHAGGLTFNNEDRKTTPTFKNATYFVQRAEWDYAVHCYLNQERRDGVGYKLDELFRVAADDQFYFLDAEVCEIIPGLHAIRTGGHTPGHQIVMLESQQDMGFYFGDLIPSEHLLNTTYKYVDLDLDTTKTQKQRWLAIAAEHNACLLFYHSVGQKMGRIGRDKNRAFVLGRV